MLPRDPQALTQREAILKALTQTECTSLAFTRVRKSSQHSCRDQACLPAHCVSRVLKVEQPYVYPREPGPKCCCFLVSNNCFCFKRLSSCYLGEGCLKCLLLSGNEIPLYDWELKAKLSLSIFTEPVRAQTRPSPSMQSGCGHKYRTLNKD